MKVLYRTTALSFITALTLAVVWQTHALGAPKTASKSFGVFVNVQPAATVALSGTTFTWNSVKTTMQGYALADKDRKSTRLNSSHMSISYAVFCLKKKRISLRSSLVVLLYFGNAAFAAWHAVSISSA